VADRSRRNSTDKFFLQPGQSPIRDRVTIMMQPTSPPTKLMQQLLGTAPAGTASVPSPPVDRVAVMRKAPTGREINFVEAQRLFTVPAARSKSRGRSQSVGRENRQSLALSPSRPQLKWKLKWSLEKD
jgi:hypothetical protein